jgi:pyridoxine/pyridoxamine 5'-phosphate oxidase
MLANYHQSQTPLVSIIARGTVIGRDRAGVVVVPAEVDYVSWTKRASYFANRPDLVSPTRGAWLSGQMSPLAKKNFQALGWRVHEKAKL